MSLKQMQDEIHAHNVNVGWWDDQDEQIVTTKLMLTVSEVVEALEGDRKSLMDDKLPHRSMLEVELADTLIRTLDIGGYLGFKIDPLIYNHVGVYVKSNTTNQVATLLFSIVNQVTELHSNLSEYRYNMLLVHIMAVAEILNCDIFEATKEKREYNATRADHKRENRSKKHGKKY